ncbi:MAG TPA: hypothetical protein ENG36_00270 [Lentisphaerae bacterium]|nr:hypothetical protein [Lentisphaerota bacterium]
MSPTAKGTKKASSKKKTTSSRTVKGKAKAKRKAETGKQSTSRRSQANRKSAASTRRKGAAVKKSAARSSHSAVAEVRDVIRRTFRKRAPSKPLTAAEKKALKEALIQLRDRIIDEIRFLSADNLARSQREATGDLSGYGLHMADQGTDNFDRDFAVNLVSSEQDVLYEIDEALQRLEAGTYGKCENCGEYIDKERLEALPFARLCIRCKTEQERQMAGNRNRGGGMLPWRRQDLD